LTNNRYFTHLFVYFQFQSSAREEYISCASLPVMGKNNRIVSDWIQSRASTILFKNYSIVDSMQIQKR